MSPNTEVSVINISAIIRCISADFYEIYVRTSQMLPARVPINIEVMCVEGGLAVL